VFSPDGKLLASAAGGEAEGAIEGNITLWDVAARRRIAPLSVHGDAFICMAFSPDGKSLAAGSGRGNIWLWNAATKRAVAILKGNVGGVVSVAFSPDGQTLASGGGD